MLTIQELRYRWSKQSPWFIHIPFFSMEKGESVFLKGASGMGKSTLLGLIAGIHPANEGRLSILDSELSDFSGSQRDAFRADHIGIIFQLFNLLPYLSVIDNVTLPCQFSKLRKQQIQGSLRQEAERLLCALDLPKSCFNKRVTALSIGQQQRVAAARALMGKPALILADEPTSSLDTDNKDRFISLLLEECKQSNASLLFVSHDPSLSSHFDTVVSLADLNKAALISEES